MRKFKIAYAEYPQTEETPFRPGDMIADFSVSKDMVFMFHSGDTLINIKTKETVFLENMTERFKFKRVRLALIDLETGERVAYLKSFLPEWLTEDDILTEEDFTIEYRVGFFKKDVLGDKTVTVWKKDEDGNVYWKYYEKMKYNPDLSDEETVFGYQNDILCLVPRKLCREVSIATFICPTCKRPQ